MVQMEQESVVCGHIRVHCTRVQGSPGFGALMVEVRELGSSAWLPVDLFTLEGWTSRGAARAEMLDLVDEYKAKGFIPVHELPARI